MFVNAAASDAAMVAELEIAPLVSGQAYCLEFYYHMYGSNIVGLAVFDNRDEAPLFTIDGGT